jgi:hypothetical protein
MPSRIIFFRLRFRVQSGSISSPGYHPNIQKVKFSKKQQQKYNKLFLLHECIQSVLFLKFTHVKNKGRDQSDITIRLQLQLQQNEATPHASSAATFMESRLLLLMNNQRFYRGSPPTAQVL